MFYLRVMATSNWTREQTIIVLSTYFNIPFNKANNSNAEIQKTSEIIGRGINSVKMKIGNFGSLDPELAKRGISGLTGASNLDREIWCIYANDREKLAYESALIEASLTKKNIEQIIDLKEISFFEGKEGIATIKTRINQQFFRKNVLGMYDNKCCITGISLPQLLVASHIVPWAVESKHRLNPENGLCLNSLHDKAFDKGLITVTPDYHLKISTAITDYLESGVCNDFFIKFENKKIQLPERYYPNQDFLQYHHNNIFIK